MPSITSWTRLEPQGSEGDIAEGYAARIYDPLWLLARQWQLGMASCRDSVAEFERMTQRPSVQKLLAFEKSVQDGFAKAA